MRRFCQEAPATQRHEHQLLVVVLEQHRQVPPADLGDLLGDERSDELRRHLVGTVQQNT